jgi:hypothetical protein
MSKIALNGPAGGTATYTVTAPTGATDRVITLPDQTATLITDSAGVLNIGSGQIYKDASGNVGIGTSSPGAKLDARLSGTSSGAVIQVGNTGSGGFGGLGVSDGGAYPVQLWGSALAFLTGSSVYGSATEKMRIDSSGNLLVNQTSNSNFGKIAFTHTSVSSNGLVISDTRTSGSGAQVYFVYNGSNVGAIQTTSSATSYVTSSDYRLKNTIAPMTGALAKVALLKPCTYKWNVDGSDGEGFIAHELAEVAPQCVTGEKDAVDADGNPQYQGIDTSFLVATLTAAIQEQQALIVQLQADVAALEGTQP